METLCPTCGAECKIGGDNTTHFYIPAKKYSEEELKDIAVAYATSYFTSHYPADMVQRKKISNDFDKWILNNKQ